MTLRIGFAVGSDALRMVGVDRGRVLWAGETPLHDSRPIEAALGELLGTVRLPRWPRPRAALAVGPARAQAKRLDGLPPLLGAAALRDLVRENAGRFFLRNGIPLLTTAGLVPGGETWGGALEAPVVVEMGSACRRHRIALTHVLPAAAVLGRALDGERVVWDDGDARLEIVRKGAREVTVRRGRADGQAELPRASAPLERLGEGAWRFADAYGAAVSGRDEPLALRLDRVETGQAPIARWRLVLAGAAAALALVAALLAPSVAARLAIRRAEATLAALAPRRAAAANAATDLERVTGALADVAAFAGRARSATGLLATLTAVLPAAAQLVSVQIDSAGGTIVALAPHAEQVVDRLDRMPQLAAAQVVGPVTREYVGSVEKERVTIRFRWGTTRDFATRAEESR